MGLFKKILNVGEGRKLKLLESIVPEVAALEPEMEARSDDELRRPHRRVPGSASPTARTSTSCSPRRSRPSARRRKRVLGQRHFDVQIMGGAGAALRLGRRDEDR